MVLRAHFNGLIPRNPFAQFHISPNTKDREYLTEDDLKILMAHVFESATLSFVRDIFVFACFTPYRNLVIMQKDKLHTVYGEKVKKVSGKDLVKRKG